MRGLRFPLPLHALLKKRRALETLKQRGELEDGYLKIPADLVRRILAGDGAS